MSDLFFEPDDATALSVEERQDLIPAHIAFRRELNELEQSNIARAQDWAMSRRRDLLTEKFVRELHKRMLGNVWKWAGKFRTSERNIGIPYTGIAVALRLLLDDTSDWVANQTYAVDEIAVRFHHRLVQIHPFPNGNGRHSRLMADLLAMSLGAERFSWGSTSLLEDGATRQRYIAALQLADRRQIGELLLFARS